jgi:tetratricopeptide (TPR) repeat protein
MLTGRRPFRGHGHSAVIYSIMHAEPDRPNELRADLPPEVEAVVLRLLQKDPADRYEGAAQLAADLTPGPTAFVREVRRPLWQVLVSYAVGSWLIIQLGNALDSLIGFPLWFGQGLIIVLALGLPVLLLTTAAQAKRKASGSAAGLKGAGRLFTWRRAVLGGASAFALLGAATAGYMAMRTLGIGPPATLIAQGVLEDRGQLIVAEFENQTRDSLLAPAITEAMVIDLAQSPALRVVERRDLEDALERMDERPDAKLDAPLAREVALREGIGAVVSGRISQVGAGYSLSAQLMTPKGDVLASTRETAADETQIIPALDRLSKGLRERIGESLRSLRNSQSLEEVTTSSLEALKKYTHVRRGGGTDVSVALHEEILALDTMFAMAWRSLGADLSRMGEDRARMAEAYTKAFELRDRVPTRERYLIEADYHGLVSGELDKSIAAYDSVIAFVDNPQSWYTFAAINNMGIRYLHARQFARMEELSTRELERIEEEIGEPAGSSIRHNLVGAQVNLGKFDAALATLDLGDKTWKLGHHVLWLEGDIFSARGDYETAETRFNRYAQVTHPGSYRRTVAYSRLAALASTRGRLREAAAWTESEREVHEARGRSVQQLGTALDMAERHAWVTGDTSRALRTIAAGLARHPMQEVPPANRPYARLVSLYAMAANPALARELMAEYDSLVEPRLRATPELKSDYHRARGEVALAGGDFGTAIDEFRQSDIGSCMVCAFPGLARAYERAGDRDSALAYYERYAQTPSYSRLRSVDQLFLARSSERLGELYDEIGDPAEAATYYGKLVRLWTGADEELQPRVQRAERRLDELCRAVDCESLFEADAPTTGSLRVAVRESGQDLDLNGYAVRIDLDEESTPLWAQDPLTAKVAGNGSATIPGLEAGSHTAHLIDLWGNCEVDDGVQTFDVPAGGVTEVAFEVTCSEERPASVDVTGSWAGEFSAGGGRFVGTMFIELEQVGDDVVGSWRMVIGEDDTDMAEGQLTGRVSARSLTTGTDFSGHGRNQGRIHFFLDVSEDRMEGDISWDGYMTWGTMTITRSGP